MNFNSRNTAEIPMLTPSGISWFEKIENPVSPKDATKRQLLSVESGLPEIGSLNGFGKGSPHP
jgi:hypothetical protein